MTGSKEVERLAKAMAEALDQESWDGVRGVSTSILETDDVTQAQLLPRLIGMFDESTGYGLDDTIRRLLQRRLPLDEAGMVTLLRWSSWMAPYGVMLKTAERYFQDAELTDELREALRTFRQSTAENSHRKKQSEWDARIGALLGEELDDTPQVRISDEQPWAVRLRADLADLQDRHRLHVLRLLEHASLADGGKPTAKWRKRADALAEELPGDLVHGGWSIWLGLFDAPSPEPTGQWNPSVWHVPSVNADLMKGMLWLAPAFADDALIRAIAAVGLSGQRKIPGVGPRAGKVTNAAIWALSQIDLPLAIGQLAILRSRIKNKSVQKQIDKAMHATAERLGVSPAEVEELAVPTFGLADVGALDVAFADFTAELRITGSGSTALTWRKPEGKPQKSVPKFVREEHADELKALKATAKDIEKLLPAQRDRLDQLHLKQQTWPLPLWRERYLDHVLVGSLARRLIWVVTDADGGARREVCWLDGQLVDAGGAPVETDEAGDHVSLWHPIERPQEEVLAWRTFFEERELRQPFKQAHREVYLVTDAELETRVYSNRFAAHILKQHQFNALCGARGWRNSLRLMVDDEYPPATLELPAWNLRAEFWIEGIGENYGTDTTEAGTYLYLATDQVRFYSIDATQNAAHAGGGGYRAGYREEAAEPIPQAEIHPLVFSEVMRDVDLFVGVASVGNDPNWLDGGPETAQRDYWHSYSFGDLSATAATRKELLQRLVPRLKIADRCSFQDRFLVVRGEKRTYKIHLGSGNILMEPDDRYLCIVPGRGAVKGPAAKVFLPFEGDRTLSIILSKTFLLAADAKITDSTILSQIG